MNDEIRKRLKWIKLYEKTKNASLVCHRCGISPPTLRKWWQRYQAPGEVGLQSQSHKPKTSPNHKVLNQEEQWILTLRRERNLGARRIQHELERLYSCHLSLSTIQKVLQRHRVKPLKRVQQSKGAKRYQKDIPGERVQLDTCQIRTGLFQYTAIDDCT
jgi:transposase